MNETEPPSTSSVIEAEGKEKVGYADELMMAGLRIEVRRQRTISLIT